MKISFESGELIEELKADIAEFGGNEVVAVWQKLINNHLYITNYDFIVDESPIKDAEKSDCERIVEMTLNQVLKQVEEQDRIV